MFLHCELLILILVLTLHGQVHTIIGGREAVEHSRPYMVLLKERMQDGKPRHCGGFLLNEDFVMTAAQCQAKGAKLTLERSSSQSGCIISTLHLQEGCSIEGWSIEGYNALLGVHDATNRAYTQIIAVEKQYLHVDFNEDDYKGDIMLLKLSSKAKFSKDVKPIALADHGDGSLPTNCSFSGWGVSDQNSTYMTNVLMEVNVTLVDEEKCPQDNVYCSEGDTGPRKGDSGGPLVCGDGKAYGVVSILLQDLGAPKRYHYTKIPDYRSWIDSIMKP